MKKSLLIMVLCLTTIIAFAQTKKKAPAKKKAGTASSARGTTGKRAVKGKPGKKPTTIQVLADTTAKEAAVVVPPPVVPLKPFDRPLDGYVKKNDIINKKVTAYPSIREADAVFSKRIWREFDIREKMNLYMGSPHSRLYDILMDAVQAGELTAYDATPGLVKDDPDGDEFSVPLTPAKVLEIMSVSDVRNNIDKKTGDVIGKSIVHSPISPDSVVRFRLKEDWIFDKQRSEMVTRIVGIAPMIRLTINGVAGDYFPAFWIYFKDARPLLATKEAFNHKNDATGISYDDVFNKRLFTSYIVKQSNDKDERIKDYAQGIDRLYEAERIKKNLMEWELNLWQY